MQNLMFVLAVWIGATVPLNADDVKTSGNQAAPQQELPAISPPPGTVPLNQAGTVLIDSARKRLFLKSKVCLRQGILEMLLCLKQTKEHEAIVSLDADAIVVHAGLLAIGAVPGRPARYGEKFEPPAGQRIDIYLHWLDPEGKEQRQRAQTWIRRVTHRYFAARLDTLPMGVVIDKGDDTLRYDPATKELLYFGTMSPEKLGEFRKMSQDAAYRKALDSLHAQGQYQEMTANWVFAGSGFATLMDGTQWYQAQAGNVICVANFGDAMLDVDIESSGNNSGLLYEPYTERIPPIGTTVLVELAPVPPAAKPVTAETQKGNQ